MKPRKTPLQQKAKCRLATIFVADVVAILLFRVLAVSSKRFCPPKLQCLCPQNISYKFIRFIDSFRVLIS